MISTFSSENLLKTCSILSFFTFCFFRCAKVVKFNTNKSDEQANTGSFKHEWEQSFQIVPIHLWSTRGFSSVPDYGYSSWLLHPVSSTIFCSPELSCSAFYNITFQLSIRLFRRIVFLNEVPFLATFPHFFRSAVR